jgi:endo-1,4-beta-xylanase
MSGGTATSGGSSVIGGSLGRSGGTSSIGGKSSGGGGATVVGGASTAGGTEATGGRTSSGTPTYGGGGATSLCKKYVDYFPIGASVDDKTYTTHADLLTKHFNSITAEDQMKFDALEPTEGSFNWGTADNIVKFATTNNMKVRGHTLVWHRQNPSWVFSNGSGGEVSKDALLARMKSHITNVMRHFQGKVYAWDVVNEAIMENGAYRTGNEAKDDQKSQWYKIIGESYVAEAFKYAHDADPNAKLFYNDFYDYIPAKRQAIYNMLKGLLDSGIVVHGVGLQTHLNIEASSDSTNQAYYQHVSELEEAIKLYSSLGLEVQITEMDVSVYIPGVTYTSDTYYTSATFTDAVQAQQAERYREFFALFRQYRTVLTGVTLWGIADDSTWLSEFSSGRKDFPLLFDTSHQPKKAYYAVVDF